MAKTKKKTKAKAPADRYATQVGAESTLKFGPEESSLQAALRDAESGYSTEVAAARGTRRSIEEAAKTSKPKFAKNTATSLETVKSVKSTLAADLAKLPAAGALAGASSRDAAGTERRLAEALTANQSETDARARDAASGEAYAVSNARNRLGDNKEKIAQRQSDMAKEKGAFSQARSGELAEAAADRRVTTRGQDKTADTAAANRRTSNANADATRDETARHNRETEKNAADAKNGRKPASPKDTEKAKTAISRALEQANRVKGEVSGADKTAGVTARDRAESAKILVNGREGQTIENDKDGNALANPVKIPGVKATEELYASVALDLAYDGHLSTKNMKALQKLGLSVRDLGLNTKGRSGTKVSRDGAANPVVPKPLKSGTAALGRGGGILPQPTKP